METVIKSWVTIFILIVCMVILYICALAYPNLLKTVFSTKKQKNRLVAFLFLVMSLGSVAYLGISTEITGKAPAFFIRWPCALVWFFSTLISSPKLTENQEKNNRVGIVAELVTLVIFAFVVWSLIISSPLLRKVYDF